ncbi:hypothetical protein [Streptomyces bacillaris]|uniref:hypothetical protein n=1 Tax=Streptomyces bacillaris TaxID=68179 RepID=UPI003460A279
MADPQPLYRRDADTIRLIADLKYAAQTAAVLLRDVAEAAETGRRLDPDLLRSAARSLAEIADRD